MDNELKTLCEMLADEYGHKLHFQILAANKTDYGWNLSVQRIEPKTEEKSDDNE